MTNYVPRPDDEVARWLRRLRDDTPANVTTTLWNGIDEVLDEYQRHALWGVPLDQPTPAGYPPGD